MSEATRPPRSRLSRLAPFLVLIGGFALFTWLSGGPPAPEPQGPPASAAPTPRSSAETAQATEFLSAAVRAAGLGVITGGADVRPPLPPQYNDLPRVVVRGASANDPLGIPLLAVVFPDATFTLRRSGSLLVIFQRTPSADPDPSAAESLLTVLSTLGEEIPLPR